MKQSRLRRLSHQFGSEAGTGRLGHVADDNGDSLPEVVVGGTVGVLVLTPKAEADT